MRLAILFLLTTACSTDMVGPSLELREAEAIDPRLPVGSFEPAPGSLTIEAELNAARDRLIEARAAFDAQASRTGPQVSASGDPGSESWVSAQESLSLLIRAREPIALLIADLDTLITQQIEVADWASPTDRRAASLLMAETMRVDAEQAALVASLSERLGA